MVPFSPTQTVSALKAAAGLFQAGRHVEAREVLNGLLRTHPGLAEAHRMMAGSFFQTDDYPQAQTALGAWLRSQPGNVEAHVLLGRVLAESGQPADAERALRRGLDMDPGNLPAASVLARMLLTANRVGETCELLEPLFKAGRVSPEMLMLYGHARMSLGHSAQAEAALRRWLQLVPNSSEARLRLAAVLASSDRYAEAAAEARASIANAGKTPEAAFVLAGALLGERRFEEAEIELRQVVRAQPAHVTAQANLSELVWMRSGDADVACAELDAALEKQPQLHSLRICKARLLLSARRAEDALATIDTGLRLAEEDPDLLAAASTISLELDAAHALACAQRLLAILPADYGGQVALGNASLATGSARKALEVAESLHEANPADGRPIAMKADALRMLGDSRYRQLLDYQGLVRATYIDVPDGWPDLATYLAELVHDLTGAHTLRAHPTRNSLREGSQVQLVPSESPSPSIRAFPEAIDGPVRRYMEAIGRGSDPMRCRNVGRYELSGMWSVQLRPHGFHVNHYHSEGWISSACYLHLPPAVAQRHGEGWIKFGEPPFPTEPALSPEYFIKPEPGLLVLFPSYMWHGTVPFSGSAEDRRLTIAFDLLPAGAD
ncbi:MAG: tetratricopeptide repeat protein [Rhodanobacter sp.]